MKRLALLFIVLITGLVIYNLYPEPKLSLNTDVNLLIVNKSKHQLLAFSNGNLLKTYTVSFGNNPLGHKEFEGDEKTPEGIYFINAKNDKSGYHKNLGISYPNSKDLAHAKAIGKSAGGDVKIHALKNGRGFINKFQRWYNWTNGCIALTNSEIDELYANVSIGTKIEINP
ncbi:murein L,D-transpeptidase family protein [Pedobacter fastidiosus]|uniref:L,D-transpeptidase family protein n=1 Tax=Pedobacter fastidiosus TaxID=2765361 RepID=A0ABR7KR90_9SPHI|nr:L,D-transpeptidase family protein [Pedobacter fastidiosus]MBC6110228.1 L,D-transpeptidase family protein [Pedobacter fastidiosus]